jgi:TIR domain/F5/8 type C domain
MIAISYRREDSLPIAGRLYDRLQAKFGKKNVFMDFDSIPPGADFRQHIKQMIERSNLVIAIIGPHWLGEQPDASRRIDNPADFVRLEIAYALEGGVPVIPLLINTTQMPKPEMLPADIQELAFRHALPLDSGMDFHTHADRLITGIRKAMAVAPRSGGLQKFSAPTASAVNTRPLRKIVVWSTAILLAGAASSIWFLAVHRHERQLEQRKPSSNRPNLLVAAAPASPPAQPQPEHSSTITNVSTETPQTTVTAPPNTATPIIAASEPTATVASSGDVMSLPPASSSGFYQKTRDGHAFVWNNYPSPEDEAEWSGAVDESGYATGQGTLSWFKRARLTSLYTGTMVAGKFNGNVINDDPDGKRYSGTYINGVKSNDWQVVGRATSNHHPSRAPAARFAGTWEGKMTIGTTDYYITLNVNADATSLLQESKRGGQPAQQHPHPTTINGETLVWIGGDSGNVGWRFTPNADGQTASATTSMAGMANTATFTRLHENSAGNSEARLSASQTATVSPLATTPSNAPPPLDIAGQGLKRVTAQPATMHASESRPSTRVESVNVIETTASSELKSQIYQGERKSYNAELAFDGDKNTAWCASGGGVGEWIMARFQSPTMITGVSILGGYGTDSDRYRTNNRVQTLRVAFSDGTATNLQLEDKMQLQHFSFPRLAKVEWVRFEILSVYRGTRYDATPISEIQFEVNQSPSASQPLPNKSQAATPSATPRQPSRP